MAENENIVAEEKPQEAQLESGTYEIIRKRLDTQAKSLQDRLKELNAARKDVFGAIETELIVSNPINSKNNAIARDVEPVGTHFLFGYNVRTRLKKTTIQDVFSIYRYEDSDHSLLEEDYQLLEDAEFQKHFEELYQFYKEAVFVRFATLGDALFMIFQIDAKNPDKIKVFKWLITDGKLVYQGNRGEHEFTYPDQQEFEWKRARRDAYREGDHPHISIQDRVFVETVGGDLTIKVEDNTETGEGIYAEPVDSETQTLDDAEFLYADLGNLILLKIKPHQEKNYRYLVFNEKLQQAVRIDKIEEACILLPDNHGLIFSNGYYLESGELKVFDNILDNLIFEKSVQSPNGEDFLYVFHNKEEGIYVLLPYNLIEQKVESPITCNGYSLFEKGELLYFRSESNPSKSHMVQIWQTPFVGQDFIPDVAQDNFLFKIGNKDIVRSMAEVNEVLNLLYKEEIYSSLYSELVSKSTKVLDTYPWLNNEATFHLDEPLKEIRTSATSAIEEFEKVNRVKQNTEAETQTVQKKVEEIVQHIKTSSFSNINEFVQILADLRTLRGESISLRSLRYINETLVDELEETLAEENKRVSESTVRFLLEPKSLDFYKERVKEQEQAIAKGDKVMVLNQVEEEVEKIGKELDLLIEIVSNLKIEDSTQTTQIIDNISSIYATLNQAKAQARTKKKDLRSVESVAEFNAQIKLISQSVVNYLDISDTPQKAEEFLTKLMVQLEELEGKFADFEEFIGQITEKREEIYNAFESKKLALTEARNRRASALQSAANRILKGIQSRAASFKEVPEINGYFASDMMIEKIRDLVNQLVEMEESVKADEIQSRLKSLKEDAIRQLKDRQEIFTEGENIIQLGRHKFSVNVQKLDLSIIRREEDMYYHLAGTNFFEKITDTEFLKTREVWNQEIVSENQDIYRAEYLAYQLYQQVGSPTYQDENLPAMSELAEMTDEDLLAFVQKAASSRYQENYIKGVHDLDATKILRQLVTFNQTIDLLRYPSTARACASYFWQAYFSQEKKELFNHRLKGIGLILNVFPESQDFGDVVLDLQAEIQTFIRESKLFPESITDLAGEYLFYEITRSDDFIISQEAAKVHQDFKSFLKGKRHQKTYEQSLKNLEKAPNERFEMIRTWMKSFLQQANEEIEFVDEFIDEVAVLLYFNNFHDSRVIHVSIQADVPEMMGSHSVIQDKTYHLNYNDFMLKLNTFEQQTVPRFQHFTQLKKDFSENFRQELRLDEFKPRVLSSFVRNKLINEVYLHMIGDNLAKQMGVVGENKRTDLMGMLLLISPPGYGKTTLMEYISNRLGLIFMKINGPAIGHEVTSIDPAAAPNAASREEVKKLNLAFEMGDNVMIYLDDIQHCNPEFLQKFISLADGQRKIEGVYRGKPKTYDLRGRKVAVVMAGNPYTESGDKFQIPDMLSNRADTYNLGDILGDSQTAFELSYIENSLTSNPVLNKLANRSQKDIYTLIRLAETDNREGLEFEGNFTSDEVSEFVAVLKKIFVVRDYVLRNNMEYIRSAAQSDEFRTEPPFKLQGSYRDMNKMAEKVVPIMNDTELQTLIMSHYENEAQTLTTGAEANLLKFKELNNILTEEETQRWEDIKKTFQKNNQFKGVGSGDQVGQVLVQLSNFNDGLESIRETIEKTMRLSIAKTNKLHKD